MREKPRRAREGRYPKEDHKLSQVYYGASKYIMYRSVSLQQEQFLKNQKSITLLFCDKQELILPAPNQ